jgi:hypothetical protein
MSRFFVVFLVFSALIFVSCDNQKAGTFAVKFSWAKDDAGKEVKPDVSTGEFFVTVRIYEWKEGVAFPVTLRQTENSSFRAILHR